MTETHEDTGYERLFEDFGQMLAEAEAAARARRRRRRRPRAAAAALALALAGILVGALLLTGAGGGGRLDVVAQAKAALAPPGQVVHLVTTSHMEMRGGSQAEIVGPEAEDNAPRVAERWSASEPTRWRIAATVPFVTADGAHPEETQLAYAGGTEELYLQALNRLQITSGVSEDGARVNLHDGALGADPVLTSTRCWKRAARRRSDRQRPRVERLLGEELGSPPWVSGAVGQYARPRHLRPRSLTVEESTRSRNRHAILVVSNTYEQLPSTNDVALLSIHPAASPVVVRR